MAKSPSDFQRETAIAIERLDNRVEELREGAIYNRSRRDKLEEQVAALRTELTALAREFADHKRRAEVWAQRWWALGAALALAAAVALLRRPV